MPRSDVSLKRAVLAVPGSSEKMISKARSIDVDELFLDQKIGTRKLSRKSTEQETSDLCVKAFEELEKRVKVKREMIDCLVVVTQNPDGDGLPHTSAIVHAKLNLSTNCAAFDISLGCSGYVYALSIIKSFM